MITYIEKGYGLHEAIKAAGQWLMEFNGVWVASNEAVVQDIIDSYSVSEAVAPLILQVKALAREKILAFLPDWKQSNYNARMNELNETRFSRTLTDAELAEIEVMRAAWARAKAIRTASDRHEAGLRALADFAAVAAYDIEAGWEAD